MVQVFPSRVYSPLPAAAFIAAIRISVVTLMSGEIVSTVRQLYSFAGFASPSA